jgi:hypothetical protein
VARSFPRTILLYDGKSSGLVTLAIPSLTILVLALLAALQAVFHPVRIDSIMMLETQ